MATETTSTFAGLLKRVYTNDIGDFFLSQNAEFFTFLGEATDLIPAGIGAGFYFPFQLQSSQAIGQPSEGGSVPTTGNPTVVQGSVTLSQFVGQIDVSWLLEKVATGDGAWKKAFAYKMKESLGDVTKHVNRIFAGTHGTGRLALVNATVTATSFVAKISASGNHGAYLLRPNMIVDSYDTDTGGSAQNSAKKITKIVKSTRSVTFGSSLTWTAGHGIYLAGAYGNSANGLMGLVDDGTFLTSVHGQSRSTYEELKAVVAGNSGSFRDLSDTLLTRTALDVWQQSDEYPDLVALNSGQWEKYHAIARPDRRNVVSGKGVPAADTGFSQGPVLMLGDKQARVKVFQDIAPRHVYLANTNYLKRVGDARPDWINYNGSPLVPGVSTTYTTSKMASLYMAANLINTRPNAHGRIEDLSDAQLCGAAVGGSDT